jgi:hypothetical protein
MASPVLFCVVELLLASTLGGVRPVPESSCATDLVRLVPCLPFVDGNVAAPSDTCCTNLGSMVHDEPQCMCQALSQPGASPIAVNMTRVLGMPSLCRLDVPSATDACRGEPSARPTSVTASCACFIVLQPSLRVHDHNFCRSLKRRLTDVSTLAALMPHAPPPPTAPVSASLPNVSSTVPSTLSPATPTPTAAHMTPSPRISSPTPPGYSRGSKVVVDRLSVVLGFVALLSVQAF